MNETININGQDRELTGEELVFHATKEAILKGGFFREVDLYNEQFERENSGQISAIKWPAAFIEFTEEEFESMSLGSQKAEGLITVYLGNKWTDRNPDRYFELNKEITKVLHRHERYRITWERSSIEQIPTNGKLALSAVTFKVRFEDHIARRENVDVTLDPRITVTIDTNPNS